jgi:hypothetical protein
LLSWCIAGAAVGGILGSLNTSITGIVLGAIYLIRRSGRSMSVFGVIIDAMCLLICALLIGWGLIGWTNLERWGVLAGYPSPTQFLVVSLIGAGCGTFGGLLTGAALGWFTRRR